MAKVLLRNYQPLLVFFTIYILIGVIGVSCSISKYHYYSELVQLSQADPIHDSSYFMKVNIRYSDSTFQLLILSKNFVDVLRYGETYMSDEILINLPRELAKNKGNLQVDTCSFYFFSKYFRIEDSLLNPSIQAMPTDQIIAKYFDDNNKLSDTLTLGSCLSVIFTLADRNEYIYSKGITGGIATAGWPVTPCIENELKQYRSLGVAGWFEMWEFYNDVSENYSFTPCECEEISIHYGRDIKRFYYVKNRIGKFFIYSDLFNHKMK